MVGERKQWIIVKVSSPIIVTFVHGTFDAASRWADTGALIREKTAKVTGKHAYFTKFEWSGANLHEDRHKAAVRLIDHIEANAIYFPNSPHILIGHSHGGNIIRWTLQQAPLKTSKRVTGVITISTPFLEARPRPFGEHTRALFFVWRMVLFLTFSAIWLFAFATLAKSRSIVWELYATATSLPGLLLALFLPLILSFVFIRRLARSYEDRVLKFLDQRQKHLFWSNGRVLSRIENPFLRIYTRLDEVRLLFEGARVVGLAFATIDWILGKARKMYLPEAVPGLILLAGLFFLIIFIGYLADASATMALISNFGLPMIVVGIVLAVSVLLTILLGVFLFGTTEALDLAVIDFRSTLRPTFLPNAKIIVTPPRFKSFTQRTNTHTGILYGEEVAWEISKFIESVLPRVAGRAP